MTNEAILERVVVFWGGALLTMLSKVTVGAEWLDMIVFSFVGGAMVTLGKEVVTRYLADRIFKKGKDNGKGNNDN
jgi:membrane protein implicated in regulation of membrane protease activity